MLALISTYGAPWHQTASNRVTALPGLRNSQSASSTADTIRDLEFFATEIQSLDSVTDGYGARILMYAQSYVYVYACICTGVYSCP